MISLMVKKNDPAPYPLKEGIREPGSAGLPADCFPAP